MIKSLTAGICAAALMTTLAFAQGSQPQGGPSQSPTSSTSEMSKPMKKSTMKKHSGTTGSAAAKHGSMKKDKAGEGEMAK